MATPLVVALHGGGGNGQKMATLSRLSLLADQNGFIVAYPERYRAHRRGSCGPHAEKI